MGTTTRPHILFLNMGWMERYNGDDPDDRTRGNFGWLNENKARIHGHECFNFFNQNGFCFGCHPSAKGTDINKLGAQDKDKSINDVLVIWFSRQPWGNQKAYIVGWYQNATVYRSFQDPRTGEGNTLHGEAISYKAKARYIDCHLLPISERQFPIPSRHEQTGGYGQNPNWYGLGEKFLNNVWSYIKDWEDKHNKPSRRGKTAHRNTDPIQKVLVEQTAIRIAEEYYCSEAGGNCKVRKVERENLGWDIEATNPIGTLKVEVKGVSGSTPIVELTPNEYAKMQEHKDSWVLFIVAECLSKSPKYHEFRYFFDSTCWESSKGGVLKIQPKTGAIVSLK